MDAAPTAPRTANRPVARPVARPGDDAAEPQRGAADPGASVWVAASAGTGKTKVLVDRVLRLLLNGTAPHRILCLTYTKAAAAEMSNRVAQILSDWTTAAPDALRNNLFALLGRQPGDDEVRRAPELFVRVLEAPGGLGIQTIHAFCQSLLGRFPLEAGVPPHFGVMDDRDSLDLLRLARHAVLDAAERDSGALAAALATITRLQREFGFSALMSELTKDRARLRQAVDGYGSIAGVIAALRRELGLTENDDVAGVIAAACDQRAFDAPALRRAATALASGSDPEAKRAQAIGDFLAAGKDERVAGFEAYRSTFLTEQNGNPPALRKKLANAPTEKRAPGTTAALQDEGERLRRVSLALRAARTAEATAALLLLGGRLLDDYQRLKDGRGLLDYDDLIEGAVRLLHDEGSASWVLYKLDGGIDHLLIDEAQDTAPAQWQVIRDLTLDFFAGEGARAVPRTIFAVGDVKQSIYSFQGADPASFIGSREWFAERVRGAKRDWRPLELKASFRSTRAVLAAVDATFADEELARSIALERTTIVHQAFRLLDGGAVEVWPLIAPRDEPTMDPWSPPVRRDAADQPQVRLAALVAARIAAMLSAREMLEACGRPIEPGDIMILVRRRTPFMQALVRALKKLHVPVAGVDRMVLTEQMAVLDLLAIGHFALLPDDDLTLATVLKGPLIGFTEEALFALAHGRPGSLWKALAARAAEDPACAAAHRHLADVLAAADTMPPFEFFTDVLARSGPGGDDSGRRRLLARLGRDAEDPLAEFLDAALQYERTHAPSLQGFLHWVETTASEITRDPEPGRGGAVRVMTVHGAKGLQAPVVFLPDTTQTPRQRDRLQWLTPADGGACLPLWPPRKGDREDIAEQACRAADARQLDEYRRLLYVAMTRASDRLIVCGWVNQPQQKPAPESWYARIHGALANHRDVQEGDDPWLAQSPHIDEATILRIVCPQETPAKAQPASAGFAADPLPAWAMVPAAAERPTLRPLRPSYGGEDEAGAALSPIAGDERLRRGRLIHRLLEELPDVAPAARAAVARRWLARPVHRLPPGQQDAIAAEVLAVIADPAAAAVFGPGSRAEVPVSGEIAGRLITGQIDRLVVTDDAILILDYKSDRPAPPDPHRTPAGYLRQMAAYRALLRRVYSTHPVRCLLLWTEAPRLMWLPEPLLDRYAP